MPSTLVTGATGTFGAAVTEMLQRAGQSVRVLIRDPKRFAGIGVQVAIGDFADPTSLDAALSGIERVFLASFDRPEMPALQRNLLAAARRQGVRHIARISTMYVDDPRFGSLMADHAAGEHQLEHSGLEFTHLRPSWVLQNFLPTSAATPVRDSKIRLPAGDGQVSFVDARDVAAVAAAALTKPGHEGRTYELTGPDARTHQELAQALSAATGRTIIFDNLSPEVYVSELTAAGWPPLSIESMDMLFADIRAGGAAVLTSDVTRVTGRTPLSIHDFARDHSHLFLTSEQSVESTKS
jgi:uncharacterized protein YbjT (DUF2867 family)